MYIFPRKIRGNSNPVPAIFGVRTFSVTAEYGDWPALIIMIDAGLFSLFTPCLAVSIHAPVGPGVSGGLTVESLRFEVCTPSADTPTKSLATLLSLRPSAYLFCGLLETL